MSYMKYKAFLKIVELSSFTKAGQCLGYTQSAISQMVSSLEEELGTALLFRNKSGVKITNEGIELLPFIRELCNNYEILNERAISINSIDKGNIKIGLIYSAAYTWFPDLMAEFKKTYPNVKYEFIMGSSEEIQNMVKSETVDFGIAYSPVRSELMAVKIMEEELCLAGAKSDPLSSRVSLEAVQQLNFIFSKGNEEFSLLEEIACKKGIHLKKSMEAPDLMSSVAMAENGLGLVAVNRTLAEKLKCNIKIVDFDFKTKKEITVVLNDLNRVSRTGKCFLDSLAEKYCRQA